MATIKLVQESTQALAAETKVSRKGWTPARGSCLDSSLTFRWLRSGRQIGGGLLLVGLAGCGSAGAAQPKPPAPAGYPFEFVPFSTTMRPGTVIVAYKNGDYRPVCTARLIGIDEEAQGTFDMSGSDKSKAELEIKAKVSDAASADAAFSSATMTVSAQHGERFGIGGSEAEILPKIKASPQCMANLESFKSHVPGGFYSVVTRAVRSTHTVTLSGSSIASIGGNSPALEKLGSALGVKASKTSETSVELKEAGVYTRFARLDVTFNELWPPPPRK